MHHQHPQQQQQCIDTTSSNRTVVPIGKPIRENAHTLLQRLHAAPVQLCPPILGNSLPSTSTTTSQGSHTPRGTSNGLGAFDVLIVGSDMPTAAYTTASQRWCDEVAAQHALAGGRVVHVYGPADGAFDLPAFTSILERMVLQRSSGSVELDEAAQIEGQQALVLDAMSRVDVIYCERVEDLYVFCNCYSVPPTAAEGGSGANVNNNNNNTTSAVIPLVIVSGCVGKDSYCSQYERAAGLEVPLIHWLICLLQRRVRCALIVTEDVEVSSGLPVNVWGSGNGNAAAAGGGLSYQGGGGGMMATHQKDLATVLTRRSDFLMRLQRPHTHDNNNSNNNNNNSSGEANKNKKRGSVIPHNQREGKIPDLDVSAVRWLYLFLESTGHAEALPTAADQSCLNEDNNSYNAARGLCSYEASAGGGMPHGSRHASHQWLRIETMGRLTHLSLSRVCPPATNASTPYGGGSSTCSIFPNTTTSVSVGGGDEEGMDATTRKTDGSAAIAGAAGNRNWSPRASFSFPSWHGEVLCAVKL